MGLKCSRYLQLGSTKPFSDLFKDRTNGRNLFYLSTRDGTKTGVSSKPHLADLLFEIVFRSGGGSGIVRSLFECQGCLESSELISDGTASLDNSLLNLYAIYARYGTINILLPFTDLLRNARPYVARPASFSSHLLLRS